MRKITLATMLLTFAGLPAWAGLLPSSFRKEKDAASCEKIKQAVLSDFGVSSGGRVAAITDGNFAKEFAARFNTMSQSKASLSSIKLSEGKGSNSDAFKAAQAAYEKGAQDETRAYCQTFQRALRNQKRYSILLNTYNCQYADKANARMNQVLGFRYPYRAKFDALQCPSNAASDAQISGQDSPPQAGTKESDKFYGSMVAPPDERSNSCPAGMTQVGNKENANGDSPNAKCIGNLDNYNEVPANSRRVSVGPAGSVLYKDEPYCDAPGFTLAKKSDGSSSCVRAK